MRFGKYQAVFTRREKLVSVLINGREARLVAPFAVRDVATCPRQTRVRVLSPPHSRTFRSRLSPYASQTGLTMRLGRTGEAFFVEPVESDTESEEDEDEDEEGNASSEARETRTSVRAHRGPYRIRIAALASSLRGCAAP